MFKPLLRNDTANVWDRKNVIRLFTTYNHIKAFAAACKRKIAFCITYK
jgi:uncharacterized protein YcaQ